MFYISEINGKKVIKSSKLYALDHCFTTRDTVICSAEENMQAIVEQNKLELFKYLHINPKKVIRPQQTHSTNVQFAQKKKYLYPDTDAIILTQKNQAAYMNFADCTPIILYDEKLNVAAIVHAGWRGTVGKIVMKTIFKMEQELNCCMDDVIAVIGPTIGKCCYEIGEEVYEQLCAAIDEEAYGYCFARTKNKIYADLKKINQYQLLSTGVRRIEISDYCTCCNNDKFFSYRKEKGTTNRHSAIVKLK